MAPDTRTHRGSHSDDIVLFSEATIPTLRSATRDVSWLLTRGYAPDSSLKLVGDRYQLKARQRTAVSRSSCSDQTLQRRLDRQVSSEQLSGKSIAIDGYNLLTTVEGALGGAILLGGRDGAIRDLISMHGTYRKVAETEPALEFVAKAVKQLGVKEVHWYLDRPVSNSGRLKQLIQECSKREGREWQVELVSNPDRELANCDEIVVTSDSEILNRCTHWFPLAGYIVTDLIPRAWILLLGDKD